MSGKSEWKTVTNRKSGHTADERARATYEADIVDEVSTHGFRTFENLFPLYSVVLLKKLQSRYPTVQFTYQVNQNGTASPDGTPYYFVLISCKGPKSVVEAAYDDAAPLLRTGVGEDASRVIRDTWKPEPAQLQLAMGKASMCAERLGYAVNYSFAKSCFFLSTVLLADDTTTPATMKRTMKEEVIKFLTQPQGQVFRLPVEQGSVVAPAPASRGRGGYVNGGGGRGGAQPSRAHNSVVAAFEDDIRLVQSLPTGEAKKLLRDLVIKYSHLARKDDTLLEFFHIAYGIEKEYALANAADNEALSLDIVRCPDVENMVEVSFDPATGLRPFTQRYPRINLDDTAILRAHGQAQTENCKVYMVLDWKLLLHVESNGVAATEAFHQRKVDITFDPLPQVGMLTNLQKSTTMQDDFDRLRGIGEPKVNRDLVLKAEKAHEVFRRNADESSSTDDDSDSAPFDAAVGAAVSTAGRGRGGAAVTRAREDSDSSSDGDDVAFSAGRGGRAARGGFGRQVPRAQPQTAVAVPAQQDGKSLRATLFEDLTPIQKHACNSICQGAHPRIFVSGPGGTGKTEVVARAALALILQGKRVVVAAATNSAADIIATRILKLAPTVEAGVPGSVSRKMLRYYRATISPLNVDAMLYSYSNGAWSYTNPGELDPKTKRIKPGTRVRGTRKEFHELRYSDRFDDESPDGSLDDIFVVVTSGSSAVRSLDRTFLDKTTHLFVDEAGSVALCDAMRSVNVIPQRATLIFSGDPNQLQPRAVCPANKPYLSICPISPAYSGSMLTYTLRDSYRSNTGLVNLQSQLFYDGNLRAAVRAGSFEEGRYAQWAGHRGGTPSPYRIIHCDGEEETFVSSVNLVARPSAGAAPARGGAGGGTVAETADKVNMGEVDVIENLVRSITSELGVKPEDIVILCEYESQRRRLRSRMALLGCKRIAIAGIEEFQGGERDVAIVSLVRSKVDNNDPFFLNIAKLCTTLTRARNLMLFVGNVPVFLEHDRVAHANRNSTGKWTQLVDTCKQQQCIDLYDAATNKYTAPPKINVTRSLIEVKEFVPKAMQEAMKAQRLLTTREEVLQDPATYFVGIVLGRQAGRVLVRNRFKCVHDVVIDEDVSSGDRRFALFPGDTVALRLAPELARWQPFPGAVYVEKPSPIHDYATAAAMPPSSAYYTLDAFPDSFDVVRRDLRPVGNFACLLQPAEDYPQCIDGFIEGGDFCPLNASFPRLPLHAAHRRQLFVERQQARAYVSHADGKPSERYYRLVPVNTDPPMPRRMPAGELNAADYNRLLNVAPPLGDGWFQFFAAQRGLQAPLLHVSNFTRTPGNPMSEVDIVVVAPAVGLLLGTDVMNDVLANGLGWSPDAMRQLGNRREYPLAATAERLFEDCFKLPTPGEQLLVVGVKFRVRYADGGMYGPDSSGAEVLQPKIVMFSRPRVKYGPPASDEEKILRDVVRRNGEHNFSPRQLAWQQHVLHMANHAVAKCLLKWDPNRALLLRQTAIASEVPVEDGAFESLDSPEWYVPSVLKDGRITHLGRHSAAQFNAYTSFVSGHHCYGDLVVQRLMVNLLGYPVGAEQLTEGNLKRLANRLTAVVLQGRDSG